MEEQEEVQQKNMISNLPLLFANGYPTSLDKISEKQLENFIPFMVQCSLGHINLQGKFDCSEPEWWPEDVPFMIPFSKPKKFTGNWILKMKEIVQICYQFHKSVFLLRFCYDLASYEHACLRFINNYNSTTSLFDRRCNKLLVTFRNENMSYDQPQPIRKSLLQQKRNGDINGSQEIQQTMVEPPPFDIYLCDNCDAELYSRAAIMEHEKTCLIEDDDVILCDSPEPMDIGEKISDPIESFKMDTSNEQSRLFLLNFNLQHREYAENVKPFDGNKNAAPLICTTDEKSTSIIPSKNKRLPRRNRHVHMLTRSPSIPISSPAGQILQRLTKTTITDEYLEERFDRMERFCHAPPLVNNLSKPKFFDKKNITSNPHCTFKKPQDYNNHVYVFPRRQFSKRRRTESFWFLNSPLLRRCRPISVRLKKITQQDVKSCQTTSNSNLNIKLTRDTSQSSNWKISPASSSTSEIIIDTINLCSSDEDDNSRHISYSKSAILHPSSNKNSRERKPSTEIYYNQLNHQPEVTLIPLRGTDVKTKQKSSEFKTNCLTTNVITNIKRSLPHVSHDNSGSNVSSPKPLRPSMYIFSNYTSNPVLSSNDTLINNSDMLNFNTHNQENELQNGINNFGNKHISNSSTLAVSEWLPGSSSSSIIQSYSSPNRVISIDLTT